MCEVFRSAGHRAKDGGRGAGLRPGAGSLHNTMFQNRTQEIQEFFGLPDFQNDVFAKVERYISLNL